MKNAHYPITRDGRYFVARNRLWRCTDPRLDDAERQSRVSTLMSARRAVRDAGNAEETRKSGSVYKRQGRAR